MLERAEFIGCTARELRDLLRAGAPYPEVSERIERATAALQSIRVALWQRELVRTVGDRRRDAA